MRPLFMPVLTLLLSCFLSFLTPISAPAATGAPLNSRCLQLVLSAGPTSEVATENYFKYLKHFLDNGHLGIEELKILKGFSQAPNFVALFESKIPEAYLYREDIERLLPFVNQHEFLKLLEPLILAHANQAEQKEKAHVETKILTGIYPAFVDPKPNPVAGEQGLPVNVVDNKLGLFSLFPSGKLLNVENGNVHELEVAADTTKGWHSRRFGDDVYFVRQSLTLEPKPSESDRNHHFTIAGDPFITAYDTRTGKIAARVHTEAIVDFSEVYIDQQGLPNIAWYTADKGNISKIFYGSNSENIKPIDLGAIVGTQDVHSYMTPSGQLYILYKYCESLTYKLKLIDVSNNGKEVLSLDLLPTSIDPRNNNIPSAHSWQWLFHKNLNGSFVFLMKDREELSEYTLTFSKEENKWETTRLTFTANVAKYVGAQIIRNQDGSYHYLINGPDEPLLIFKNGEKIPRVIGDIEVGSKWQSSPEHSDYVVTQNFMHSNVFHLVNLKTYEHRKVTLDPKIINLRRFMGSRFTNDGRIISYFSAVLFMNHPSSNPLYVPVQLYGPFNPKTGEAAP